MEEDFNILSLSENQDEVKMDYFLYRFKDRFKNNYINRYLNKKHQQYLMNNLPILRKEFDYLSQKGNNIILPFLEKDIEQYGEDFVNEFIDKILLKYDLNNLYVPNKLKKYVHTSMESDRSLLIYAVLDQLMKIVLNEHNIQYKHLKLVIIDSEDIKIEYLLELFVKDLNYLTIITKRVEYFEDIQQMIYDATGLVLDIVSNPVKEPIDGNVIIDASKNINKNYSYFNPNAVVIDLESNKEKLQYLYSRRKDLKTIYDVVLSVQGTIVNNEMLVYFLKAKSDIFSNFVRRNSRNYGVSDLQNEAVNYDMKLLNYVSTLSHSLGTKKSKN